MKEKVVDGVLALVGVLVLATWVGLIGLGGYVAVSCNNNPVQCSDEAAPY